MFKGVARILGASVLVALLVPMPVVVLADDDDGDGSSRCILACHVARARCLIRCVVDCYELFPGSSNRPSRNACIATCKAECTATFDQCKQSCPSEPSPDDP